MEEDALKRGTKRKYEPPEEPISVRIAGKLHHEVKLVHKASKKAKTFETQKVVKRLKDLRKKDETSKEIPIHEDELVCLKGIDPTPIGNTAFKSKVKKDHLLKLNEDLQSAMAKEFEGALLPTTTTPAPKTGEGGSGNSISKIQARLLSSKILAAQISSSLEALKILLDPSLKKGRGLTIEEDDVVDDQPTKVRKAGDGSVKGKHEDEDEEEEEEGRDEADETGWESGTVNEEEGDDAGWQSGSIDSEGDNLQRGYDDMDSGSEEEDEESEDQETGVNSSKKAKSIGGASGSSAKAKGQSTFLPSLAVGFIRGESTDESDYEQQGEVAEPKKNRRGQRARRAIWEKKFGRNANHKKKQEEEEAASLKARKFKTGSNAASHPKGNQVSQSYPGTSSGGLDAGWAGRSNSGGAPIRRMENGGAGAGKATWSSGPQAEMEKPIHPSWEAKRKLREKESAGIVPSQGKKIKFT